MTNEFDFDVKHEDYEEWLSQIEQSEDSDCLTLSEPDPYAKRVHSAENRNLLRWCRLYSAELIDAKRNGMTEVTPYSPRKSGILIFYCFTDTRLKVALFVCFKLWFVGLNHKQNHPLQSFPQIAPLLTTNPRSRKVVRKSPKAPPASQSNAYGMDSPAI